METARPAPPALEEQLRRLPDREASTMDDAMAARLLAEMDAEYARLRTPAGALRLLAAAMARALERWRRELPALAHRCCDIVLSPLRRWARPRLHAPAGMRPAPPRRSRRLAERVRQMLHK